VTPAFRLRDARPDDAPDIARLVHSLAEFEKLADEAVATADDFRAQLFGATPRARAMIAEVAGATVGLAIWFYSFNTFTGRPGLYVEDVFVEPAHRGLGIGRALFAAMAQRAVQAGCARMEWSVLDWNETALRFYRKLGAKPMDEWTVQRLAGTALAKLAEAG
jgi:GNAT superfamily N-acetyltransferase